MNSAYFNLQRIPHIFITLITHWLTLYSNQPPTRQKCLGLAFDPKYADLIWSNSNISPRAGKLVAYPTDLTSELNSLNILPIGRLFYWISTVAILRIFVFVKCEYAVSKICFCRISFRQRSGGSGLRLA